MTTPRVSPDLTLALQVNNQLREQSSDLRAYSRYVRSNAQTMRDRTLAARLRVQGMRVRLTTKHQGPAETAEDVGSRIEDIDGPGCLESLDLLDAAEVIDLLVSQHGFERIDASLDVALEMEREELPPRCHLLTASQALDVMHRILQRH